MDNQLRKKIYDEAFELHSLADFEGAKVKYNKILEQNPKDAEVLNLYGICELQLKNYDSAESYVKQAIELRKERYFFQILAQIYFEQNLFQKELEVRLKEEKLFGLSFKLAFDLGLVYKNLLKLDLSEKYYLKALEYGEETEEVYFNLANLYMLLRNPVKAKEYYEKRLELIPDDRETKYFLSLNYFRLKDYESGMPYFESRLCRESAIRTEKAVFPNLMKKSKLWQGEDISDKTLFTYYEAGFGDMMMFARYIPELKKRCKKLVVKPQIELAQLFKDSFPDVEIMGFFYQEKDFDFDVHIPFLSVPFALGLDNESIFLPKSDYLKSSEENVRYYNEMFDDKKFNVAIKWQGNTYYETYRVINVDAFAPLFELQNVQVYSAQTYEGAQELSSLAKRYNVIDLSHTFTDFARTAGAMEHLDLVICNDTSLAHLAGAMSKKCAILLPYNYNWRWHTDLTHCDWYDTVKLYCATKDESWNDLVKRAIVDLQDLKWL